MGSKTVRPRVTELERAIRAMLQRARRVADCQYRLWNDDFWAEVDELKKALALVDELRARQT